MTRHGESCDEMQDALALNNEDAFADAFSQHRDRLWRMVHFRLDRRLLGRVDADDILQETYLNAVQRLRHYFDAQPTSLFVWLRSIALQTMIDVHRRHLGAQKRNAEREISLHAKQYPQATSASIAAQLLGQLTSPSKAAMRAEIAGQLEHAFDEMDEIDKEVLALRHFEEMSNGEVAEVLGITQKAASIRYIRALKRLKKILAATPGFATEEIDD